MVFYFVSIVGLIVVVCIVLWAMAPARTGNDPANADGRPAFALKDAILLIGPDIEASDCARQRRALRSVLPFILEADQRIIEIYGDDPPAQNGEVFDWLDNQLLRDTLHAQHGFHLIIIGSAGDMMFHATRPVASLALAPLLGHARAGPARLRSREVLACDDGVFRPDETASPPSGEALPPLTRHLKRGSLIARKPGMKPALRARRGHAAKTQSIMALPRNARPAPAGDLAIFETERPAAGDFTWLLADTLRCPDGRVTSGAPAPRGERAPATTPIAPAKPAMVWHTQHRARLPAISHDPPPAGPPSGPSLSPTNMPRHPPRRAPSHIVARLRHRRGI